MLYAGLAACIWTVLFIFLKSKAVALALGHLQERLLRSIFTGTGSTGMMEQKSTPYQDLTCMSMCVLPKMDNNASLDWQATTKELYLVPVSLERHALITPLFYYARLLSLPKQLHAIQFCNIVEARFNQIGSFCYGLGCFASEVIILSSLKLDVS